MFLFPGILNPEVIELVEYCAESKAPGCFALFGLLLFFVCGQQELNKKEAVAKDLLLAMQTEEEKKFEFQQQLAVSEQRSKLLDHQLKNARKSLIDAKGEAEKVSDAYHSMKRRASSYQSENSALLNSYDDWMGSAPGAGRSSFAATGRGGIANLQRAESAKYSDRISALLERRNSMRK